MARDYSPTHFYLRVPNHLLERYFKERYKALEDIEFKKLKENKKSALHVQNISDSYWKRRNDFSHIQPNVKRVVINNLSKMLSHYFRNKEGRRRHCKIDIFRRNNKEYFFVYLSNFG